MHAERSSALRRHVAGRPAGVASRAVLAAFAALTSALVLAPTEAHGFCRTRAVPTPAGYDVETAGCWNEGELLYHPSQCLPYHLLAASSPEIPSATLSNTLAVAFGAWTSPNPTCTPGITVIELAPVDDTKIVNYTIGEHGHNVVGVVEGPWPHADGNETLALATLTFNASTGEVYDIDLEIRSDVAWSFTAKPPATGYDLESVLTHEAGHFLGLSHSPVPGAVMDPTYEAGSVTQRTLAADDQAAVCAIFPDRSTRVTSSGAIQSTACSLAPSSSASSGGCSDPAITHGCSVGTPRAGLAGREGWWWMPLVGLGALVALARRSRRPIS